MLWGTLPYFFLVISKNYIWVLAIGAVLNLISVAGFIFFLDESPLFLYGMNRNEEADRIL